MQFTQLEIFDFTCVCDRVFELKMTKPKQCCNTLRLLTNFIDITNELASVNYQAKQATAEPQSAEEVKGLRGIEGLKKRAELARKKAPSKAKQEAEPSQKNPELELVPRWVDAVRAVPNAFLRSAVFGAVKPGVRAKLDNTLMSSVKGLEVRCTGERLDQGDLDAWLTVLHLCRGSSSLRTTGYKILKALGFPDSGKNRETLEKRLLRLAKHTVEVKQGTRLYVGHLFAGAGRDEATGEWVIDTNPRITAMLDGNNFTLVGWSVRHSLVGQQLAQWLHAFYSSHADPFPIKVETLYELSGSEAKDAAMFKKVLKRSLEAVKAAFKAQGQPFDFSINDGLVSVNLRPSKSQRKHLLSKKKTG